MHNPVLALDLRLASRRSRFSRMRYLYAAFMLVPLAGLFWVYFGQSALVSVADFHDMLDLVFWCYVLQHFVLLLIGVPIYLAGAITDEKAQGTLPLLLTTDLTPWQIVVGKLWSRLLQVGSLALVGLPLFCFAGAIFGLVSWAAVVGLVLLTAVLLFALGAWSLWVSVRSDQTREAAVRLYATLGLGLLALWGTLAYVLPYLLKRVITDPNLRTWLKEAALHLRYLDPFYVLAPSWGQPDLPEFYDRLKMAVLAYGALGLAFLILAAWRLRPEAVRYVERSRSRQRKAPKRQGVADDPIRWRERVAGRPWVRWLGAGLTFVGATGASWWVAQLGEPLFFLILWGVAVIIAGLFVGVRASGAISRERERQTWDTLLVTPMETWEIVVEKRGGVMESFYLYYAAFALPTLLLSLQDIDAAVYSAGMLVFCASVLYFMASMGIWRSASSRSSWRSLVATVATGYGYCLGVVLLVAAVSIGLSCLLGPALVLVLGFLSFSTIPQVLWLGGYIVVCLVIAWRLQQAGDLRLWYAQSWIDATERYGRTFLRSLSRALRGHSARMKARKLAESATTEEPAPAP